MVRKFPHLVDVPATASLVDTHENGLPRVVQSPSAPSGAVTSCAFLKLILHFGEPWSRGLRKQRWLPGFVAFLSWHSICWLQTISWLPWSTEEQTDIHPLILAHLLTAASPRKIGLLSHFHWSETIPLEKSDAGFLRTWSGEEERGWQLHLYIWPPSWQHVHLLSPCLFIHFLYLCLPVSVGDIVSSISCSSENSPVKPLPEIEFLRFWDSERRRCPCHLAPRQNPPRGNGPSANTMCHLHRDARFGMC